MRKLLPFFLILLLACSTSEQKSPKEMVDLLPSIQNEEVSIAYDQIGKGDVTILFVHGWCINKSYWAAQMEYLGKKYRLVALDLSGHGTSGANRITWTIEDFAQDVIAVIEGLDLKKVILIGHSMGGNIILEVANHLPNKVIGFIGIDNFKDLGAAINQEEVEGFLEVMEKDFANTVEAYARGALFHPASDTASIKRVVTDFRTANPEVAVKALRGLLEHAQTEISLIKDLQVPIHLICGDATPTNEKALEEYSPKGFSVQYMKGVGHYPMIERPKLFNQLLENAIESILVTQN